MNIGKVVGSVVCTVKTPTLEGIKLLVVRQIVNGQEKGLLIAFINRDGHILIPTGNDTIEAGDTVMLVTTHSGFNDIRDILA